MIAVKGCGKAAKLTLILLVWSWSQIPQVSAAEDFDSLYSAIAAANAGGESAIALTEDITLSGALPAITGSVTIDGAGHTISGAGEYRIFDVNGGRLALSNATLTEGRAAQGGAILLRNGARVSIESSTLSANSAKHGGAIATSSSSDRLNVSDSSFMANIAEKSAGVIYANGGIVNITDGSFVKNCSLFATFTLNNEGVDRDRRSVDADGCLRVNYFRTEIDAKLQSEVGGGAIRLLNSAQATIEGSTFSENKAAYGGALATAGGNIRLTISRGSFFGNRASESGGAIGGGWSGGTTISISGSSFVKNFAERGGGGAINAFAYTLDISNSTFSENYSDFRGGALNIDEDAEVTITHATFIENKTRQHEAKAISKTGGKAYLRNSIIASNGIGEDCVGAWEHIGNLSSDGSCADKPSDNPLLEDLTGSPAYYPLRDRSPAVDYADPKFCLETDQLGTPRPQGGGCDIGAIESRGAIAAEPTPVPPLVCSLADHIIAANRDQPAGGCPPGSGVDTIVLDKDITLFEPLPAITSQIVIEGNGHSISGGGDYRIFDVDGGTLTVKNLTMTEGSASNGDGGAIRLQNHGRATVADSRFVNNRGGYGGAIRIRAVGTDYSRLIVSNSSFIENVAGAGGGAINANGGMVSVSNSSFMYNRASQSGGAINMSNFTRVDVTNSSFIDNRANWGGSALAAENGVAATLTHLTIYSNLPVAVGTELHLFEGRYGSPNKVNLRNSIIAAAGPVYAVLCVGNLVQNVGNLIEGGACSPKLSDDPMLEERVESPAYPELMPGSPAIDAADPRYCTLTDQLGRERPRFSLCDIGAIESVPVSTSVSDCTVTTTHTLNFREQPGGTRFGTVPESSTVPATARTPGWFQVEYRGASGWISADYVIAQGECD